MESKPLPQESNADTRKLLWGLELSPEYRRQRRRYRAHMIPLITWLCWVMEDGEFEKTVDFLVSGGE